MLQPTYFALHRVFQVTGCIMAFLVLSVSAEPVTIPDRIAAAGGPDDYKADALVIFHATDVTVHPNGIGESRTTRLLKILRPTAIAGQSVQHFSFDPATNEVVIERIVVHHADGRAQQIKPGHAVIQPAPQRAIYWGQQQLLLSVPRLKVGDVIETVSVKTGFNVAYLGETASTRAATDRSLEPPMPGHWYDEVLFVSEFPVVERRYTVRIPKDKPLQYEIYNGELRSSVVFDGDDVVYSFIKRDIPAFEKEPNMISVGDTECKLVLATLEDWVRKSRWFFHANEPSFHVDDDIRRQVRAIVDPLHNDEDRITALNHWVADNIRYVGTTRGPCEGYTTHAAVETFRDRAGVCKDKAGLLVAMLRAAGFESYIVMTRARAGVTRIPADQFNHSVASIRNPDGTFRLLDPTWMPKSRDNWSTAEPLQHVVYGTPEGQDLAMTGYSDPADNAVTIQATGEIDTAGLLRTEMSLTVIGGPENMLRRSMARRRPASRRSLLDEGFQYLSPTVELSSVQVMDPVDYSGPFTVRCMAKAERFAFGGGARRYLRLPMLQRILSDLVLSDAVGKTLPGERKYAMRLRSTRRLTVAERLDMPIGWKAVGLPDRVEIDGAPASLRFEIKQEGAAILYTCDMDLKQHHIRPKDYASFKEVVDKLDELANGTIVIETGRPAGTEVSRAS